MDSLSRAISRLPARWRRVLWLAEVEGRAPDETARLLGVSEAAAVALARRARDGLRLAYLLVRLRPGTPAECRGTVDRLPAYARSALPPAAAEQVEEHLTACAFCRARSGEYADLTDDLPGALRPALLRTADADDVIDAVDVADTADMAAVVDAAAVPAAPGRPIDASSRRAPGRRSDPTYGRHRRVVAVATACVAVAIAALVSWFPGRPSSQQTPPPAAAGAAPATARSSGASPSPRSMTTPPRGGRGATQSLRPGDRRPEQRSRVPVRRTPAPRSTGGGATAPSAAPSPSPTITPSPPREVCVGVLVVRLCRTVD